MAARMEERGPWLENGIVMMNNELIYQLNIMQIAAEWARRNAFLKYSRTYRYPALNETAYSPKT